MSNNTPMQSRVAKWDNARALLILLVVFGHALTPYISSGGIMHSVTLFLYSFHMPLFIFIGGLFSKSTVNSNPFKYEKIVSYVLLYFFIKLSIHLVQLLFGKAVALDFLNEKGTAWYIMVLAVHLVIARLVRKLNPIFVMATSVLLALGIGYIDFINDFLILSRIFVFFPVFYLGYILDRDKLLTFLNKLWVRIISAVTLVIFSSFLLLFIDKIYSLRYVFTGNNPYYEFGEDWYPFGAVLRLFCYGVSFVISTAVLSLTPNKKLPLITYCGENTLSIYTLHRQILCALQYSVLGIALGKLSPIYILLITFAVSIIISAVLSLKPFEYILYPIMNWKKLITACFKSKKKNLNS